MSLRPCASVGSDIAPAVGADAARVGEEVVRVDAGVMADGVEIERAPAQISARPQACLLQPVARVGWIACERRVAERCIDDGLIEHRQPQTLLAAQARRLLLWRLLFRFVGSLARDDSRDVQHGGLISDGSGLPTRAR